MPRRVQDIIQRDRRSIRNIPLDAEEPYAVKRQRRMPVTPPAPPKSAGRPESRLKRLSIAIGIIVVIAGIGFIASSYYSRASFRIIPKTIPLSVNGTYVAQATPGNGILSYSLITVKGSASTTVAATDGPKINTKAYGTVTLFNAYSASPVRLIAGTRLAGESGLIYKLTSSVLIPGYTKTAGSVVPGTLKTAVVAGEPGQAYNLSRSGSVSDLKIVAYKGSLRYDSIYARLASEITGGWSGTKKSVNPAILASTTAALRASISARLEGELGTTVPDGYIMFDSGKISAFKDAVVSGDLPDSAVISVSGTMSGILFKKSELVSKFSENRSSSSFGDFGYTAPGIETVSVTIANIGDFSAEKKGSLILKAKGDLVLVGAVPVEEIRKKIMGSSLRSVQDLFREYGAVIESGSGELVPPWAKIPSDPDRVTITVREP